MTRDEIIEAYDAGRRDFAGLDLDLEYLDLSGLHLADVDFSRAFLDASFDRAVLVRAKFAGANIKTCSFVDADLSDADFRGSAICSADFSGASLQGANFCGAQVHGYTFTADEQPAR